MTVLMIDHYDSFTFNLVRYIQELGQDCIVKRHDAITIDEIINIQPSHIVLSPGPCTPDEAESSLELVKKLADQQPILGICLGHQIIGQAFGGTITQAKKPMHGMAATIHHDQSLLFTHLPNPISMGRYHSLVIAPQSLNNTALNITAMSDEQEIMAIAHQQYPIFGIQSHPESVLSTHGQTILANFLAC